MHVIDLYAVIVSEKSADCRDFYRRWFGFRVVFEASWFVYLAAPGDRGFGLAFMTPDHPSRPPGPEVFSGQGMFLTLQVDDAAAEFERLEREGLRIAYPLRDEPWGQRRFAVYDPSGTWVDVVEQIEPRPGFWDEYAV
jgi:catechol 2,3-dioxygenase-like lactoylglutathione lyase family enzyme